MVSKIWLKFRLSSLGERVRSFFPHWLVNCFWHLPRAIMANFYYRFPAKKLFIIGVTGTDGKTTTTALIYEILLKAGKSVAVISTVSAKIGKKEIPTGLHVTSPDSFALQRLLKRIVDRQIEYVVLESTSHGLAQYRLWGIKFQIGVITNVTSEHLDYHGTYEKYLASKAKLFKKVKFAVLNKDDRSFVYLNSVRSKKSKLLAYALEERADYTPKTFKFKTPLFGEYNQYNCLAAIAVARVLKISDEKIRKAIASFEGIVGRTDTVSLGQNFQVIVDFAHTPNALESVLGAFRKSLKSSHGRLKPRLIVVFGCAGLRDRYKRPAMGRIAAQLADLVVLTAEDPRTENLKKIISQIAGGCLEGKAKELATTNLSAGRKRGTFFFRVFDRAEAINFAILELAKKGDIVIICGKGHEKSICYGKTERPWSDHREVKKALRKRLK